MMLIAERNYQIANSSNNSDSQNMPYSDNVGSQTRRDTFDSSDGEETRLFELIAEKNNQIAEKKCSDS